MILQHWSRTVLGLPFHIFKTYIKDNSVFESIRLFARESSRLEARQGVLQFFKERDFITPNDSFSICQISRSKPALRSRACYLRVPFLVNHIVHSSYTRKSGSSTGQPSWVLNLFIAKCQYDCRPMDAIHAEKCPNSVPVDVSRLSLSLSSIGGGVPHGHRPYSDLWK